MRLNAGESARLAELHDRLAATTYSDAARGLTWGEWEEMLWLEWRAVAVVPAVAPIQSKPVATARDRYGWRGLPGGGRLYQG